MPRNRIILIFAPLVAAAVTAAAAPRERPVTWATPVIGSTLENVHRVSDQLYRCEQPDPDDIPDLHALGVRSILNLRNHHTDSKAFAKAALASPWRITSAP